MSYRTIGGVPFVNGLPAQACPADCGLCKIMAPAFAPWKCPECGAHLSGNQDEGFICLNLCGMSAASARRFNRAVSEAGRALSGGAE